jgi:hypothetical protein
MTIRPSVPEIITVNSEALQTTIRDLLPSQNGFGSELQASNIITPIIDLTAAAEGSSLATYLQTALAFSNQTSFNAQNSTVVLANSPGFYRIFGSVQIAPDASVGTTCSITTTDGSTTKNLLEFYGIASSTSVFSNIIDFTVFLRAGDSVSAVSSSLNGFVTGSIRQVATGDGTLVEPTGFPL